MVWLLACAAEVPVPPCEEPEDPHLDIAPADLEFGDFVPGDILWYGTPPQGGAPYSPFHARAGGMSNLDEGVHVVLAARDADGITLGDVAYDVRFVCANVGDSAGSWVGSDLHLRFFDWSLEDLEGRSADVTITVTDQAGTSLEADLTGVLTLL